MLVFDEVEQAKKILKNKELEYFKISLLLIVARYFRYLGQDWKDVKENLIGYCKSQNLIKFETRDMAIVDKALIIAKKCNIRVPKRCCITQKELDEIETLQNPKVERIFFVMICLAKYLKETSVTIKKKQYEKEELIFWETTGNLFREARYSNNFFDRNILIGEIEDKHYIRTEPNKDRTRNHIVIETFYPDSEPVIIFDNPDKIYKLYDAYKENRISSCEECGSSIIKKTANSSIKYCEKCAYERKLNLNKDYKRMKT